MNEQSEHVPISLKLERSEVKILTNYYIVIGIFNSD